VSEPTHDWHCWDLAKAASAHYGGDKSLHARAQHAHEIYQSSTMSALLAAVYEGTVSYGEIARHGDFGVGTFNGLDGEMLAVDGAFFHLHSDGTASVVDPSDLTPFAVVTFFRGDARRPIDQVTSRQELETIIDELVPGQNSFYPIRVEGRFRHVVTRTAARQRAPYRPLVDATADQVVSRFSDGNGTLVGFRAPDYAQGITVAGYHLHFIDAARRSGGHVFDFVLESGTLLLDEDVDLHVELSETAALVGARLAGHDLDAEITAAEGPRPG
jgi:acetolactate decarboxylase